MKDPDTMALDRGSFSLDRINLGKLKTDGRTRSDPGTERAKRLRIVPGSRKSSHPFPAKSWLTIAQRLNLAGEFVPDDDFRSDNDVWQTTGVLAIRLSKRQSIVNSAVALS